MANSKTNSEEQLANPTRDTVKMPPQGQQVDYAQRLRETVIRRNEVATNVARTVQQNTELKATQIVGEAFGMFNPNNFKPA